MELQTHLTEANEPPAYWHLYQKPHNLLRTGNRHQEEEELLSVTPFQRAETLTAVSSTQPPQLRSNLLMGLCAQLLSLESPLHAWSHCGPGFATLL